MIPSRVVNIGSIDGLNVPAIESYAYGVSKAAVHHLTRVQARRLVGENILVNAIAPGPYESMMLGAAVNHDYSLIESRNPRKRIGSPEDIAGLIIFLCSRAGAYTVGAVIQSDGGLVGTAGHDLSSVMSLYETYFLPKLLDFCCGMEGFQNKEIADCSYGYGRVLEIGIGSGLKF